MLQSCIAAKPLVVTAPVDENATGRWRGGSAAEMKPGTGREATESAAGPAVPVAGAAASRAVPPASLVAGGCLAWPLSLDATCAGEGRRVFREAASGLGLPDELIYDGMTMASELAANTRHAQENVQFEGAARLPVAGAPELWLYLRRTAGRWELVCNAFDSLAGWRCGSPPRADGARKYAESGRGLQIVAGLSGGRWGHHLSRSRLGGWKVPGKVVWFAQPLQARCVPGRLERARPHPCQVSRRLEVMLADRGLGGSLLRAGEAGGGISVLSVRRGLTVWCLPNTIMWRTRAGIYEQRSLTDLEDTAERIVSLCEELDSGQAAGAPASGSRIAQGALAGGRG
jgi:hypothetical protein